MLNKTLYRILYNKAAKTFCSFFKYNNVRYFVHEFRVVAIDQRGYGESEKPNGIDEYTLKKLMSDIKQIISALGKFVLLDNKHYISFSN